MSTTSSSRNNSLTSSPSSTPDNFAYQQPQPYQRQSRKVTFQEHHDQARVNTPTSGCPPNPIPGAAGFDPNLVYIISGPYPSREQKYGIMVATPIPRGATVIARPLPMPASTVPTVCPAPNPGHSGFNPQAPPFSPSAATPPQQPQQHSCATCPQCAEICAANGNCGSPAQTVARPMVTVFNAEHPEGTLVPMRQPAPPIYYNGNPEVN